jgi:outer membrane protein OmpA-like peptidoglycan-associated protein
LLLGVADLGLINLKLAPDYAEEQAKTQVPEVKPGGTTSAPKPLATPGPSVAVAPPQPTPTPEPPNTAPEPTATTSALPVVSVATATPPAPTAEPEPLPPPTSPTSKEPPPAVASGDKPAAVGDVLFEIDSNLLTLSSKSTLDEVLKQLKANPSLRIHLRGHSDQLGSREHNLELSRKRAAAVENFFHANGIPHSRITTEAVGGMKPADPTNTPTAWARNRRVEIEWR